MIDPADAAFVITPSDTDDLEHLTRALYIGGAGNVNLIMGNNDAVLIAGLLAGTMLPIIVKQVLASGTSATSLVGFY